MSVLRGLVTARGIGTRIRVLLVQGHGQRARVGTGLGKRVARGAQTGVVRGEAAMQSISWLRMASLSRFGVLCLFLAFLGPRPAHAEACGPLSVESVPPFDVISCAQYELLREALLGSEGVITQGWGTFDPVNEAATRACHGQTAFLNLLHLGVDYGADLGTPISSVTAGQIVRLDPGLDSNCRKCLSVISIFNPLTRKTFDYLHLVPDGGLLETFEENKSLKQITTVGQGDILGTVGARGLATGPHLHFQVKLTGKKGELRVFCIDGTFNPYEAVFPSIYVTEFGDSNSITKIDAGTLAVTTFDGGGSGFVNPEDMTTDADGRIYVAESDFAAGTSMIERINPDGTGRIEIDSTICGPEGLVFSKQGDLYTNTRQGPCQHTGIWRIKNGEPSGKVDNVVDAFSDFGEGTAFLITGPFAGDLIAAGSIIVGGFTVGAAIIRSRAPNFGNDELFVDLPADVPVGLAVNSEGDVFVTSVFNGEILQYDSSGASIGVFVSGLDLPHFIEFDSADNLYVAERNSGNVSKIDPDGNKDVLVTLSGPVGLALGTRSAKLLLGLLD